MSRAASRVERAIVELDRALAEYLQEEIDASSAPGDVTQSLFAKSILWTTPEPLIDLLREHLPVSVRPWAVFDMAGGVPVRIERVRVHGRPAAVVYRNRKVWRARLDLKGAPKETGVQVFSRSTEWDTSIGAMAACDYILRSAGFKLFDCEEDVRARPAQKRNGGESI